MGWGRENTNIALFRSHSFDNRLKRPRNDKLSKGALERIRSLIDIGMMALVNDREEHNVKFLKDREKKNKNISLPWQCVVDSNKDTHHSKVQLWLDGTESNRSIHKIEAEMPEISTMKVRWRTAKLWTVVEITESFCQLWHMIMSQHYNLVC